MPRAGQIANLAGKTFGEWSVISYAGRKGTVGKPAWLCRCSCGVTREVMGYRLTLGKSLDCGCTHFRKNIHDLAGQRFGRLLAIEFAVRVPATKANKYAWRCLCDCGKQTFVPTRVLQLGHSRSCGCLNIEEKTTHGRCKTRAYKIRALMRDRCNNPNSDNYANYGGRGIRVCDRWNESFEAFLDDMGDPPSDKHTLDRIDNDGDYEPDNCRWATRKEQMNNIRKNVRFEHDGESLTLSQWAEKTGIKRGTICGRLKFGWSFARAITEPLSSTYRPRLRIRRSQATFPFLA